MVLYFNKKDLISFGNYLLSNERRQLFTSHPDLGEKDLGERLSTVHDSDVENWKYNAKAIEGIFEHKEVRYKKR